MKTNNILHILSTLVLIVILAASCAKEEIKENNEPPLVIVDSNKQNDSLQNVNMVNRISGASVGEFSNSQPYALNIVYFIPTDLAPYPNFQKRLSDLMLWSQKWFKDQLEANGYPNTTFGLFTSADNKNVRLNIVFGTKGKASYEYNGGSGNIMTEVNSFFAANPNLKTSDHTLIILPAFDVQASGEPGGGTMGPPFYGLGRNCFALDYPELDIKYLGKNSTVLDRSFVTWFGGMVHELGHGLNLPHNRQKVSEGNDPNKGMSLMWAGNSTLGISPTFLTGVDAAILDANQVFSKVNSTFYSSATSNIKNLNASYNVSKASIIIGGKYEASVPVKHVLCYNDPNVNNEGTGVNKDYNAIAWATKPIGLDSFYFEMPISELVEKSNGMVYEAKIKFVHENGIVTEKAYSYTFSNGVPVIDFGNKAWFNKSLWQVIDVSSEETNSSYPGQGQRIIDNNDGTYWHTNWSSGVPISHPHHISIDCKQNLQTSGISFVQRQDSGAGRSRLIEVWSKENESGTWIKIKDAELLNLSSVQNISFPSTINLRYLKIVVKSSYPNETEKNCSIAEVNLY